MSTKIQELRGTLQDRRDKLAAVFDEAGPDMDMSLVKSIDGDADAKVATIRSWNDEMTELGKEIDELDALGGIKGAVDELGEVKGIPIPAPGGSSRRREVETKSLGEALVESDSYKAFRPGTRGSVADATLAVMPYDDGLKATLTTATATVTGYDRQPGIVLVGTVRLTVADLLSKGQTTLPTVRYVQEDTFTNAATAVAEGTAKPEATFDTSEVDAPVRKIAVVAKVTDEIFADFPAIRDYVDNRLRYMVGLTEEAQLLNGSGTAPNIRGILATAGIQTQAKATDTVPDAIYKGIVKVRTVGFFEPDGAVIHPDDWADIRLLKTTDGAYIWGAPMDAGPERIWGLPVVVTPAIVTGTGLVGAFKIGAQVFYREGMRVEATNSNEDDFKTNLIAIRAEQREALAVYRPKAFCTVTGI